MADRLLPAWPRLLTAKMAASYLGISETALYRRQGGAGRLPKPVSFGGRELWDRAQLDRFVDELSGGEAASEGEVILEGLARARRAVASRKKRAA